MKDEGNAVAYDSRESDAQCPDGTYSAGTTTHWREIRIQLREGLITVQCRGIYVQSSAFGSTCDAPTA